jgi:2-dehydro-3-deoxyphosphogluconate aldolase/(4S)-4-hydroxy-2-oxoglutarate aldolase
MINRFLDKRIVPVVVLDDANNAVPLAESLLTAGLDVIEVTFRTEAAEESIRRIAKSFPEMLLGAGTLVAPEQVKQARDAGAVFGLAPGLNPRTVEAAHAVELEFSPGVMTPSEVEQALSLDCTLLKFFPAEAAGGITMLKSLAGPYSHTGVKFIPTGGINTKNLENYLRLPVVAAIGGSWMVNPSLIKDKNWPEITRLTQEALELATQAST